MHDSVRSALLPWYRSGLRFSCTGCGGCCTGAPGYVWVNRAERESPAKVLDRSLADFEKSYTRAVGARRSLVEHANGDCAFFDPATRRCRVYAVRPRQCRTWPFWQSNLRTQENWEAVCRTCPGAGRGPVIPLEEIEAQARVMRI